MNNLKIFVFAVFFTVLALPVLAEPNSTEPAQQAIIDPCQIITATLEPVIQPQPQSKPETTSTEQILVLPVLAEPNSTDPAQQVIKDSCQTKLQAPEPIIRQQPEPQPQTTTTEQIIEKAHYYYNSELNKALIVIGCLASLLTGLFIVFGIIMERLSNRRFDKQLEDKEKQLQKYFDDRLVEEIPKLKEDAQKQLDTVIGVVKKDFRRIYYNLSLIYSRFYQGNNDNKSLCFCGYLKIASCLMAIDLDDYAGVATDLTEVKDLLSKITEKSGFELIDRAIKPLSEKIRKTKNKELQKLFDELYEDFILKKHGLGYTTPSEDKQEVTDLLRGHAPAEEPTPAMQSYIDMPDGSTQAIAEFAKGQGADILKTDDAAVVNNAIAENLGKEPQDLKEEDYDSVTELSLYGKKISDITLLKQCKNMVRLHLSETRISDISALNGLTKLTALWLDSTLISDISALNGLTNLSHLYLSSTQISDISSLGGLTKLRLLDLNKTKVNDLTPIRGLDNLAYLGVSTTQLDNIQAVSELTNLRFLGITNTKVRDLTPIKQLKHLENLFFSDTLVDTLEPLKDLKELRVLSFRNTKIDTLKPLKELTGLQTLKIQNTLINSLEPIKGLGNLKELLIEGCTSITTEQIDELQSALPDCKIPAAAVNESLILDNKWRLFFNPKVPGLSKTKVMRFDKDGVICDGRNINESSWQLRHGYFEMLDSEGQVHSRFYYNPDDNGFFHTNDPDTGSIRKHSIRDQYMILIERLS